MSGGLRALLALAALAVPAACGGAGDAAATGAATAAVAEISVAAASDLRPAFTEVAEAFTAATGIRVRFSFGSSGQLRSQILNGAPFDLFASANVAFVDEVIAAGRGVAATKADYAYGRLALWSPDPARVPATVAALADPRYRRIAIANPEHAPYGVAARQALETAGVHDAVKDRLVYGDNVADALRIAASGNADVAIVALSLAIADGRPFTVVPAEAHEPLRQALVVTATGARGEAAARFAAFISSPEGREVMVRYGFVLPGVPEG